MDRVLHTKRWAAPAASELRIAALVTRPGSAVMIMKLHSAVNFAWRRILGSTGYCCDILRRGSTAAADDVEIGQQRFWGDLEGGGKGFAGQIADVRVWTVARTAEEIWANAHVLIDPSASGLVANFDFVCSFLNIWNLSIRGCNVLSSA